jgi:hypothetical protein
MTPTVDEGSNPSGVAATGLLRIVGASGAVCVDGTCTIDPVVQPRQEDGHAEG